MSTSATGNFPELLWPGIASLWGHRYKNFPPLWKQFMDLKKSDKSFEKEQGLTGLPIAGVKDEGSSVTYVEALQGFQKEFVNVTYGLGVILTRELVDDDQYNFIKQIPGMLADSLRQTEEVLCANLFNNGFSGGTTLTADGLTMFNSAHVNVGGGTQSNVPSVASDLSQASMEQAYIDVMGWTDDRGLRKKFMIEKIMVAPANQFVAEKILKTSQEVGTNNNTINPMKGKVTQITNPYLTDPDAWFLRTDSMNGSTFYRRRAAELSRDNDHDSDNMKVKQTERFAVGVAAWQQWYGSAGA